MAAKPKAGALRAPPAPIPGYYTPETYSADDSVGFLIAALRTRIFKAIDIEMSKLGFTAAQWTILRFVAAGETPTAADLCRRLNYDTGSMTRMLTRLERKGVIAREPSSEDRRIVRLRLTPAGRKLYPKLRDIVIRVLNHLTAGMSADEIQALGEQLKQMRANLEAAYGADL
ncbi:MAG TPA: MarR family transcriptional regulator [Steroidobacteraceae bacterium]|jgi:DNA-binding MarR family transcriptional regulator